MITFPLTLPHSMQNSNNTTTTNGKKTPLPRNHVVVCAFPFGGHATSLLNLVRRMAATASNVTFSYVNIDSSNATLFKPCGGLSNIVPCGLPGSEAYAKMNYMEAFVRFLEEAAVVVRRGIAAAEAEVGVPISCVVGDAFLWCCGEIAEEKSVPWFPIWTSGQATLSCHLNTDIIRNRFKDVQERTDEKIGDCVPGFSNTHFSDIPKEVIEKSESPFGKMLYEMAKVLPKSTAVVINSVEEFSPIVTKDLKTKIKLFNLGPFSSLSHPQQEISDENGCLPWLNKHTKAQSVVYIAFGTFLTPPKDEIVALAVALEDIKVPFIWSMSDKIKMELPPSFLNWVNNNEMIGKIVSWAPQRKILVHPMVGVFITHCGWNSVLESIASAMPMICRSIIGDQMSNQRFVAHELKFGIGVDGGVFTKESVVKALKEVLFSEVGVQLRKNAMKLKKIVDETTKLGGSLEKDFNAFMELVTCER